MDLMKLNETEMYLLIDSTLKNKGQVTITVYCAIHGNHNEVLKSNNSKDLKAFATKYTRNNTGFNDVYLS